MTVQPVECGWHCRYGNIAGLSWGAGQQPQIIALHGWLDNAASFSRLAPLLNDYQLIALDLPGHGHSDWLGSGGDYSIWSGVEAVYDVLQQLPSSAQKPVLMGHSMGAAVAMLVAGAFPDLIGGYIALDAMGPLVTPPSEAPEVLASAIRRRKVRSSSNRLYASIAEALQARTRQNPELSDICIEPVVLRNLVKTPGLQWRWRTDPRLRDASQVRLSEEHVQAFYGKMCDLPALIVRAESGIIPRSLFTARLNYLPAAHFVELPGHHHFHLDPISAVAVADAVHSFLQELL